MTNKEIIDGLKYTMDMCLFDANTGEYDSKESLNDMTRTTYDACEGAIKALEQTCIEDYPTCTECEHYDKEKHYCPRFCQVIKDTLAEAQPCEDCISREEMLSLQTEYAGKMGATILWRLRDDIRKLPSVKPKYTDEEIDKAQAVEQAYVDKMVELAVKEIQRPKGKWIKIQSGDKDFPESIVCSRCKNENSHLDFDEHSVPIGKVFVTSKYCPNCGAEMSGGEEDGEDSACG